MSWLSSYSHKFHPPLQCFFFVLSDRSFKSFIFHSTTPALISTFFLFFIIFYFSRNELLCLFLLFSSKISSLTFFLFVLTKLTQQVSTHLLFFVLLLRLHCYVYLQFSLLLFFSFLAFLLFFVNKNFLWLISDDNTTSMSFLQCC